MLVAVEIGYHWDSDYAVSDGAVQYDLRLQAIPLQQCVDLRTTERSPVALWKDIGKVKFEQMDLLAVSSALDEVLLEHGGSAFPQQGTLERYSLIFHPAPDEIRAFGSVYGLSSERLWGHTTETWRRMSHIVETWAGR